MVFDKRKHILFLKRNTFCIIDPVFPFFGRGNFLCTSNTGFPYSFSERVHTDLCDFVFMEPMKYV